LHIFALLPLPCGCCANQKLIDGIPMNPRRMANVLNTKPELLREFLAHFATLGDAMDDGLRGRDRAIAIPVGLMELSANPHHTIP
jgi:hypothetical protein